MNPDFVKKEEAKLHVNLPNTLIITRLSGSSAHGDTASPEVPYHLNWVVNPLPKTPYLTGKNGGRAVYLD